MTEIHAKPIIDNKFWVIEKDGEMLGTLRKNEENKFVLSNHTVFEIHNNKESLTKKYGKNFFAVKIVKEARNSLPNEVHGFPSKPNPYNSMYDVRRKLPLFTKSDDSKSLYCAGYYIIQFNKGWTKAFCPKLITLQRYPYKGPFKTEENMKKELSDAGK
jgi:hypothetical protein